MMHSEMKNQYKLLKVCIRQEKLSNKMKKQYYASTIFALIFALIFSLAAPAFAQQPGKEARSIETPAVRPISPETLYPVSTAAELEPMSRLAHFRFPGNAAYDYTEQYVEYASFEYDEENRLSRESYYDYNKNEIGSWDYRYEQFQATTETGETNMLFLRRGWFGMSGITQEDYCDSGYTYITKSILYEGTGTRYSETYDRSGNVLKRTDYYNKWNPSKITQYDSEGEPLYRTRYIYDDPKGASMKASFRIEEFYEDGHMISAMVFDGDDNLLATRDTNYEFTWYINNPIEEIRIMAAFL